MSQIVEEQKIDGGNTNVSSGKNSDESSSILNDENSFKTKNIDFDEKRCITNNIVDEQKSISENETTFRSSSDNFLIDLLSSNEFINVGDKYTANNLLEKVNKFLKKQKELTFTQLANAIKETTYYKKGHTNGAVTYKKISGKDTKLKDLITNIDKKRNTIICEKIPNEDIIPKDSVNKIAKKGRIYILTSKSNIVNKIDLYKVGYTTFSEKELLQQYSRCCSSPMSLLFIECINYKESEAKILYLYDEKRTLNSDGSKQEWVEGIPLAELIVNYMSFIRK